MPSSPRRSARLILVLLLSVITLVFGWANLTASEAEGGLRPPVILSAQGTPSTVNLRWTTVPGAASYQVRWAPVTAMSGAPSVTVSATSVAVTDLEPQTGYFVQVRALNAGGSARTAYSRLVSVRTLAFPLAAPVITSQRALDPTSFTASWSAPGTGLRYRVTYGTAADLAGALTQFTTETTATVALLQPGTTYFLTVQVVDVAGNPQSPASATATIRTLDLPGTELRVASYNVACENCYGGHPNEGTWYQRRDAVVQTILGQNLDVLGVQEASQGQLDQQPGVSQFDDLLARLGFPWAITNAYRYNCQNANSSNNCSYLDRGASQGTRILYNTTRVDLLSRGSKLLTSSSDNDRYMSWAIFRQKTTGKRFFFVSQHLEHGDSNDAARKTGAQVALAEINARNVDRLPVITVGDFNSTRFNDGANYPYDVYIKGGYVDPLGGAYETTKTAPGATVEHTINRRISSWNDYERTARYHSDWINGSNLDYILTTPMRVYEWETVVRVDSNFNFIGQIPSDHNMIRATVYLP